MESSETLLKWKAEQAEVKALYNSIKNGNEKVRYRIDPAVAIKLKKTYASIIHDYIELYKEEFEAFFKVKHVPAIAFDMEEVHTYTAGSNQSICLLGILLNPDLTFEIYFDSIKRPPCDAETQGLDDEFSDWLQTKRKKLCLVTHGSNQKERAIVRKVECETQNTETLLLAILKQAKYPEPLKPNIHAFEQMIGFQRRGCMFIKHSKETEVPRKGLALLFPFQAKLSMWSLSAGKNPRTCKLCNKPQDVFLYCLEDSFLTILIYMYHSNHVPASKP
nr:hypothetical protein [Candidatus Sigynarchaeota archaeon]